MKKYVLPGEWSVEDEQLRALFTRYIQVVLSRAKRDYLEKERRYRMFFEIQEVSLEERYDIADPLSEKELERIVVWEMIKSYIKELSRQEQKVVVSVLVERQTHEECAKRLGVSRPRVGIVYKSALEKLKRVMAEDDMYEDI